MIETDFTADARRAYIEANSRGEGFSYWQRFADLIDRLFAKQGERIAKLEERVDRQNDAPDPFVEIARAERRIEQDVKKLHGKADDLDRQNQRNWNWALDKVAENAERIHEVEKIAHQSVTEDHLKFFDTKIDTIASTFEKQISDLADRLSMVHVQAQGDAKIRTSQHWADLEAGNIHTTEPVRSQFIPERTEVPPDSAWQPEDGTEPQPARVPYRIRGWAEERIAELKEMREKLFRLPVSNAGAINTINARIIALDSEIGAETQPADLDAQSTVERDARLDELTRLIRHFEPTGIGQSVGSDHLIRVLMRRYREIEEGK